MVSVASTTRIIREAMIAVMAVVLPRMILSLFIYVYDNDKNDVYCLASFPKACLSLTSERAKRSREQ